MTDTDKSELEKLHKIINRLRGYVDDDDLEDDDGDRSWLYSVNKSFREAEQEIQALITQQCNQARIEGEKVGAFMAASAILTEMSPLMIHRLENGFPSMTAEVIGNVYEVVKNEMKPYQDIRKAQAKETQ